MEKVYRSALISINRNSLVYDDGFKRSDSDE